MKDLLLIVGLIEFTGFVACASPMYAVLTVRRQLNLPESGSAVKPRGGDGKGADR